MKQLAALAVSVIANDEIARQQIHLFPVVMNEGGDGVDAGIEFQQPRPAPHLAGLIEITRQNLLLDSSRIAGRCLPAFLHVDRMKFEMRLVHRHDVSPWGCAVSPASAGRGPSTRGRSSARE